MLFFRSEVALNTWLQANNTTSGETLTVSQLWQLSQRWYHNRIEAEYHGRSLEQVQDIFKEVGLVSDFWR